jgi:hypothetical protein
MNVPRLESPTDSGDTIMIHDEADELELSPDVQTPIMEMTYQDTSVFEYEEEVKPKKVKLSPEDTELQLISNIINKKSFFTFLYYMHENFDQIHKSNREKVIFRDRILSKIKNQVEKNRYETIQTLMNNFLKLG